MEITVKAAHLRALALIAPTKDVRYYLNGIYVDASLAPRLVATCGCLMGVINAESGSTSAPTAPFAVRVPVDALKALVKVKGSVRLVSLDGKNWIAEAPGVAVRWAAEPEVYPDWRRAFSAWDDGSQESVSHFDPRHFSTLCRVASALGAPANRYPPFTCSPRGAAGALIRRRPHPHALRARIRRSADALPFGW